MNRQEKLKMLDQLEKNTEEIYLDALKKGVILIGAPPEAIRATCRECRRQGCSDTEIAAALEVARQNADRHYGLTKARPI